LDIVDYCRCLVCSPEVDPTQIGHFHLTEPGLLS
jgi:hypothetical protein